MTKSELKTGDIVKLRNGNIRVVIGNVLIALVEECDGEEYTNFIDLEDYNDDLTYAHKLALKISHEEMDIMRVKSVNTNYGIRICRLKDILMGEYVLIWDWWREEIKEVTMAEVEAKFGCKVKIIKE